MTLEFKDSDFDDAVAKLRNTVLFFKVEGFGSKRKIRKKSMEFN